MRRVMVRYKVRPDRVQENEGLLRAVYAELKRMQPTGLRYAPFRLEDGVSFVHVAQTEEGQNPLTEVAAFREFQKEIGDRCEEPPVVAELHEVGSYHFFGS